jgi:hypothetical protein
MGIYTHVTRGTAQTFALAVGDVLSCPRVPPQLRHAEVHHIDGVSVATAG